MIEEEIRAYIRGETIEDPKFLLAQAANTIDDLREQLREKSNRISDLGWAVEFEQNRADAFDPRYT